MISHIPSVFVANHSGNYGDAVTLEKLKDFHRRRVQILANSGADLIAFETTPNKLEAKVTIGDHFLLFCASVVMLNYHN